MRNATLRWELAGMAVIVLIVMIAAFSLFTYYLPHIFLFEDPISNQYGILKDHH